MRIGIDKMAFATTNDYLDLVELAKERGVDPINLPLELDRIYRQLCHLRKIL